MGQKCPIKTISGWVVPITPKTARNFACDLKKAAQGAGWTSGEDEHGSQNGQFGRPKKDSYCIT